MRSLQIFLLSITKPLRMLPTRYSVIAVGLFHYHYKYIRIRVYFQGGTKQAILYI